MAPNTVGSGHFSLDTITVGSGRSRKQGNDALDSRGSGRYRATLLGMVVVVFRCFLDWVTAREHGGPRAYEADKRSGAVGIAARYSRGNVSVQNGLFMNRKALDQLSANGDRATRDLAKKFSR